MQVSAGKWTYTKVTRSHTFAAGEAANGNLLVVYTGAIIASRLQYLSVQKTRPVNPNDILELHYLSSF